MGATIAGRGRLLESDSSEPNAFGPSTNGVDVDDEEVSKLIVKVVDGVFVDTGVLSCWVGVEVVDKEWSTLLVKVVDGLLVDIGVVSCWVGVGVVGEEWTTVVTVVESSGAAKENRNSSILDVVKAV